MPDSSVGTRSGPGPKELKKLRGELCIVLPFLLVSLYFLVGSFRYKHEAATVPMIVGAATALMVGLRLVHICFPASRIGRFDEAGLAGEFDQLKGEIEEETLKGKYEDEPGREITFGVERKAFLSLFGSCLSFVLFGYIIGMFLTVIGTAYGYGYRKMWPLFFTVVPLFALLYGVLIRLFDAPASYGLVLTPILASLGLVR